MIGLTYTLLGDGPSDRLLEYPIRWALSSLGVRLELGQWADLRYTSPKPATLRERACAALELYPAQLLVVHRDAESEPHSARLAEIQSAVTGIADRYIAIVPVRMTESWFLHDEQAIRRASGNPNGGVPLNLPTASTIESLPDPKSVLEKSLLDASDLPGRRREKKKREFPQMRARTAELITTFAPLAGVPAFKAFLTALKSALVDLGHLEGES